MLSIGRGPWDGVHRIVSRIRQRGSRRVFCNKGRDGRCRSARLTAPKEFVGEMAYVVLERELEELSTLIDSLSAMREFFSALLNSKKGAKMFSIVSETWNPVTGCPHGCVYCWARRLATTKLRNTERYREGFVSRFNPKELRRTFSDGVVFVSDMGDLFANTVKDEWIRRVIEYVGRFPNVFFLFLTKNPERYRDFLGEFPPNSILGATIETDDDDLYLEHRISAAPLPSNRYRAMRSLSWPLKFISIEPILDFSTERFAGWLRDIAPFMVYVGYDNYDNRLPEPPLKKTKELLARLSEFTLVIRKTIRPAWFEGLQGYSELTVGRSAMNERGRRGKLRKV